ncbi:UNVERIFIED_CONTAM: Zinc finger BED domain-containing protein RICESLEEPER 3 [Sesamum radiatum]|uniref:Zinc finger BED domain-containing protein RICESLEEPER 3 n=1 Tax=Sesamum radiatum TaxID=300843 RepID=A0AAW2UAD1_SESRA
MTNISGWKRSAKPPLLGKRDPLYHLQAGKQSPEKDEIQLRRSLNLSPSLQEGGLFPMAEVINPPSSSSYKSTVSATASTAAATTSATFSATAFTYSTSTRPLGKKNYGHFPHLRGLEREILALVFTIMGNDGLVRVVATSSSDGSGDSEDVTDQFRGNKRKQSVMWEHFTKVRSVNNVMHAKYNYCEKLLSGNAAYALPLKEAFSRLQRIDKQYKFNPPESEWKVAKIVHECLQIFYEATRHFSGRSLTPSMDESTAVSSFGVETRESLRDFDRWYYESQVSMNQKSELESYLDEVRFPRVETFNILDWWNTNSPKLSILAKIARDILAVPATIVALEAAFSVGGWVIDESRACLLPDVVKALVVADDWIGPKNIVDNAASSET